MSQQLSTNTFGCAKWIVSSNATQGTHTTIATALTSASSGDTIFIRPGTYTENLTLKAGVNLVAFNADAFTPNVIINGKCTFTAAGSVSISGIQLQTNSDFFLAVTGSAASIVNLNICYLNALNNTGISFSTSNASAQINLYECWGDLATTGIALFSHSSSGMLTYEYCNFTNSGLSTTASTISAGVCRLVYSNFTSPFTSSGTATFDQSHSIINCTSINTTAITIGGSGNCDMEFCAVLGGTASAISISQAININGCNISSTNTNAITGAGSIGYSGIAFTSTSSTINVTTQIVSGTLQGSKNTAPTDGMLGQQLVSATSTGLSTGSPKSLTNIALTAGVWDISGLGSFNNTIGVMSGCQLGIGTTNNAFTGCVEGDSQLTITATAINTNLAISIPAFRVILSGTTTYYLIAQQTAASGTLTVAGRISATRVG